MNAAVGAEDLPDDLTTTDVEALPSLSTELPAIEPTTPYTVNAPIHTPYQSALQR